ncbi:hypothetical protein CDL15_Pgr008812 [Punica granatum]|uniref:Uncharacterized protein n=1 Tax=Punica granatum TaxID=22663 RepID=A0A218VY31_PUNGR|nr:hypothetical protein CDL15_Pgr008812 [Punica granatum]
MSSFPAKNSLQAEEKLRGSDSETCSCKQTLVTVAIFYLMKLVDLQPQPHWHNLSMGPSPSPQVFGPKRQELSPLIVLSYPLKFSVAHYAEQIHKRVQSWPVDPSAGSTVLLLGYSQAISGPS